MKNILGLDIGTNSIGWALIAHDFANKEGKILGMGSRILPMDQKEIGDFNSGKLKSAVSERTRYRGVRRLIERRRLRRNRLIKVLKSAGFINQDYSINNKRSFAYTFDKNRREFKFQSSYKEMLFEFRKYHGSEFKVPHDWTIYYLRKKALTEKITKEELAWVIMQFNAKRGYYQLRGDNTTATASGKYFVSDKVVRVELISKGQFEIELDSGIIGEYKAKEKPMWGNDRVEFIVTERQTKSGFKVTLSTPGEDDWTLRKKKSEQSIKEQNKTVGAYIYDSLLHDPKIKIRGKEVHTIDRDFYKTELDQILSTQEKYHDELSSREILRTASTVLYKNNESRQKDLSARSMKYLIIEDIIFYQRPLKSKKHLIADCKYEKYTYRKGGQVFEKPIKAIAKSHPLFQEFRIWSLIHNLKVYKRNHRDDQNILRIDVDFTESILTNDMKYRLYSLFDNLSEVSEKQILKLLSLDIKEYRINYEEGVKIKGNDTKSTLLKALVKKQKEESKKESKNVALIKDIEDTISKLNSLDILIPIWHALYSIDSDNEVINALKHPQIGLSQQVAEIIANNVDPFQKEYGALSKKAIETLLSLMRCGDAWSSDAIAPKVKKRINKIIDGEWDEEIADIVRDKLNNNSLKEYQKIEDFSGVPEWLASYIIYDRHSEYADVAIYNTPDEIDVQKLIPQHSLRNPTVEKILRESMLVVRDIWKTYGKPDEIHVEMARSLKLPNDKRNQLTNRRNENRRTNERVKALLRELKNESEYINPYSVGQQEMLKLYEEGAISIQSEIDDDIKAIRRKDDPTTSELQRYKLWLDQKYISPYTGQPIPLSRLFSPEYEIEHVIPRSLYYDNSLNNKIICERDANQLKDNRTAYKFVIEEGGAILKSGHTILLKDEYEALVNRMFWKNKRKLQTLMSYDVPQSFISSQLNNTRYISKKLIQLLDPIVRDEKDTNNQSRHILPLAGAITHQLKRDWGLHDIWKQILAPRFERMNEKTQTEDYYEKRNGKIHLSGNETEIKRLDHRHHALDALIIACTTRHHIQYISSLNNQTIKYELEPKIIRKRQQGAQNKTFIKPWASITTDAKSALEDIVVSFKQNMRIINKTTNYYQKYVKQADDSLKKQYVRQAKSQSNWSIRKPLHKDTVYGRSSIKEYKKAVPLSRALNDIDNIAKGIIKKVVNKRLKQCNNDIKALKKDIKKNPLMVQGQAIEKVDMIKVSDGYASVRKSIDSSFSQKVIQKVIDQDTRNRLSQHLKEYGNDPAVAFSPNGLVEFNKKLKTPMYKVKLYEDMGKKFAIHDEVDLNPKYVEAQKGTNLFFVIYVNNETQEYLITKDSSIPLYQVIYAMKNGQDIAPPVENHSWFTLSPLDLVYVPDEGEDINLPNSIDTERIYKCVSFTKQQAFFIQQTVASPIVDKKEFSALNKEEKSWDNIMIKRHCVKLKVDRLGRISQGA